MHQLEKIYVLDILSLSCRNIINLRKIPQKEQFQEIFLNFSREMMSMFHQFFKPDSNTYSNIVQNVLEVAIFCQKDHQNVEDLILRLQKLIAANKSTTASENQCMKSLELIVKFIDTPPEVDESIRLPVLLIEAVEQFTSKIFTPQVIGYRSMLAGFKQNHISVQTRNYGSAPQWTLTIKNFPRSDLEL